MDIIEAITERKSIRDSKDDLVPQNVNRKILEISCRTPSAINTQPWEFTVIAKNTLDSVKAAAVKKLQAGEEPRAEHAVAGWSKESVYRERQAELGRELFTLMEIKKEDADKPAQWMERGFRYFKCPGGHHYLC